MNIEIWSDIACPFCYIGKRRLEAALAQFNHANAITVNWRSFQLNPTLVPKKGQDVYAHLAEIKGQTLEWSVQAHKHVINMAREAGLTYNFDKAVVANSFDAHRIIQLAKTKQLGDVAEERIFSAYFTEGKDIANHDTLLQLATDMGLPQNEVVDVLQSKAFSNEVRADIQQAEELGIRGVPFFIFNNKYAVSGAQPVVVFLQALQKSFGEWLQQQQPVVVDTIIR